MSIPNLELVVMRRRVDRWGFESYRVFLGNPLRGRMVVDQTFHNSNDEHGQPIPESAYKKALAFGRKKEEQARKVLEQIEAEEEAIRKERDRLAAIAKRLRNALDYWDGPMRWSVNVLPAERLTPESLAKIEALRYASDGADYDVETETGLFRVRLYFGGLPEVAKIERKQ